jgi:MYXO-CTERM domain-containing protein
MEDDVAPPLFEVYASIDVDDKGAAVGSADYLGPELALPVDGLPDGEHLIRIDIADQAGNEASDVVHFVIGDVVEEDTDGDGEASGSQEGDDDETAATSGVGETGEEDGGGTDTDQPGVEAATEGCGCRANPVSHAGWLALLLLGVSPRRRRD